jgi:hypothetical protein
MRKAHLSFLMSVIATVVSAGTADAGPVVVPEPGSIALLLTGAVGLGGAAWWLRRK